MTHLVVRGGGGGGGGGGVGGGGPGSQFFSLESHPTILFIDNSCKEAVSKSFHVVSSVNFHVFNCYEPFYPSPGNRFSGVCF